MLLYRARLGLGAAQLATVFGVYALGLVPGLLSGGPWSDRHGRRAVVLPAAGVALVGSVVLAVGSSRFAWLLLGRAIVGLGSGATFTAGTAWLQDLAAGRGGLGARRATVALSAGFGGGPLVASLLAQWLPMPLVLPYVVQGVLLVACWGLALGAPDETRAMATRAPSRFPAGFAARLAPTAPWVFAFPAVSFAVLPGLVRDGVRGVEVLFAGVVTATTLGAGVAVQRPLRPRSWSAVIRVGLAAGSLGLLAAAGAVAAASPAAVLGAAVLLGCGYGGCMVGGLRFVETHAAPSARGRITGVFYVLAYLGFVAPLVVAKLEARLGNVGALLAAAALAAVTLAWSFIAPAGRNEK